MNTRPNEFDDEREEREAFFKELFDDEVDWNITDQYFDAFKRAYDEVKQEKIWEQQQNRTERDL